MLTLSPAQSLVKVGVNVFILESLRYCHSHHQFHHEGLRKLRDISDEAYRPLKPPLQQFQQRALEWLSDGERNTPLSHFLLPFLFHLPLCHSPPHTSLSLLGPLSFTSFPALDIPLSPGSSPLFASSFPLSPSLSGKREAGMLHLRLMELWQADPSALSPGRAAVPRLRDAYLPKHTSTQKRQEYTHLHTHTHEYIYRATHVHSLAHTSTLS